MATYNNLQVPTQIHPHRIISAFANEIETSKVEAYAFDMSIKMLSHEFPPIKGYPVLIDDNDIGEQFLTGEEITTKDIGKLCWKVTDGHHRSLAAIESNLPYLETMLDYSTITNETDFKNFNN